MSVSEPIRGAFVSLLVLLASSVATASNNNAESSGGNAESTDGTQHIGITANTSTELTQSGATLRTDAQGHLRLRVNHTLLNNPPEKLYNSLLELLHNEKTYNARPERIDSDGQLHYLVRLNQDDADVELEIKPVPVSSPIEEIISMEAIHFTTLITLRAVDYLYSSHTGADLLSFGSVRNDSIVQDYIRNNARQAILLSTLGNGIAITNCSQSMIGEPPDGRTRWQDVLPALASAGTTAGVSYSLHDPTARWYDKSSWEDYVGLFHMSSTTNSLVLALRKANEAFINNVSDIDQRTTQHLGKAAAVIESIAALALASSAFDFHPRANGGYDWGKSLLSNSLSISVSYTVRDLVTELAEDISGSSTLGELVSASTMAAGSSLLHVVGNPLTETDMTYKSTTGFILSEAAGAGIGFAMQKQINRSLDGVAPYKLRAVRLGSAAILSFAMKGTARYFAGSGWPITANILSPMADGVIISNVLDVFGAVQEGLVEPWIIKPLLNWVNPTRPEKNPAIRLRAKVVNPVSSNA